MTNEERLAALLGGWFTLLAANDKAAWNAQVQKFHELGPDATRFLLRGIAMKQEQLQAMTAERDALKADVIKYGIRGQLRLELDVSEDLREALEAKLAAVPVAALEFCVDAASYTYDSMVSEAKAWLETQVTP